MPICTGISREINVKIYLTLAYNRKKETWALGSKRPEAMTCYLWENRQLLNPSERQFLCLYNEVKWWRSQAKGRTGHHPESPDSQRIFRYDRNEWPQSEPSQHRDLRPYATMLSHASSQCWCVGYQRNFQNALPSVLDFQCFWGLTIFCTFLQHFINRWLI